MGFHGDGAMPDINDVEVSGGAAGGVAGSWTGDSKKSGARGGGVMEADGATGWKTEVSKGLISNEVTYDAHPRKVDFLNGGDQMDKKKRAFLTLFFVFSSFTFIQTARALQLMI